MIKLDCLENPGSQETYVIRDCEVNRFIPFGICELPVERRFRVYHIPTGQWTFESTEAECNVYIKHLEGISADQPVDWSFEKAKGLQEKHRKILLLCRKLTIASR